MSYDDPSSMNKTGVVKRGISYSILDEKPGDWYKITVNNKNVWVQKVKKSRVDEAKIFDNAVNIVLKLEGKGLSDHPMDKGGKTRYGITQSVYDGYRDKAHLPHQNVDLISLNEVKYIYKNSYYYKVNANEMSPKLATVMLDTAINLGYGNAYVIIQRALGIVDTGAEASHWGELTDYSFNNLSVSQEDELAKRIIFERMRSRYNIVSKDKTQASFLNGWLGRDKQLKTTLSL
jgi:lysozyme family protein